MNERLDSTAVRIDLQQTFASARAIQVVVVPVGEVPPHKFKFYLDILKSTSSFCDLQEVTTAYSHGPLGKRNWREAKIWLNYIAVNDRSKDELVDFWGNFQAHRKTYCVIGIALSHQFPDLSVAKNIFLSTVKNYPSSIVNKCFAFEPMPDQPDLTGGESLVMIPNGELNRLQFYIRTQMMDITATLVKVIEGWIDPQMTASKESKEESAAFISTFVLDSTVESDTEGVSKLKKRKNGRLAKCKGDWCLLLASPLDAIAFYNSAVEQTRASNDKIWLAGSLEGLISSVILSNPSLSSPLLTNSISQGNTPTQTNNSNVNQEETKYKDEITDKSEEAINNYTKRKIYTLVVEAKFKLARYHLSAFRKKEAATILMDIYDIAHDLGSPSTSSALSTFTSTITSGISLVSNTSNKDKEMSSSPNFSPGQSIDVKPSGTSTSITPPVPAQLVTKIEICGAIAMLFKEMNYLRKFSFFIRETAVLYHKAHTAGAAHNLLNMIAQYYQLPELDDLYSQEFPLVQRTRNPYGSGRPQSSSSTNTQQPFNPSLLARRPLKDKTRRDWSYVQKIMLQNLIRTSKGINDAHSLVRYSVHLLKTLPNVLTANAQTQYISELYNAVQNLPSNGYGSSIKNSANSINNFSGDVDMFGLPLLKKITPLGVMDPSLIPVSSEAMNASGASVWLYSPFQNKKTNNGPVYWVQNEIAQVKIELANQNVFDIEVQSITLSTEGVAFETFTSTSSFIIPANTTSHEVIITGRPIGKKGTLMIKGCFIRIFNLLSLHPINNQTVGIPVKEQKYFLAYPSLPSGTKAKQTTGNNNTSSNRVAVIPALPVLHVSDPAFNGTELKLLEGEFYTCNLLIENTGSVPIHSLQISVSVKLANEDNSNHLMNTSSIYTYYSSIYDMSDDVDTFKWDQEELKKHLPLLPGQEFVLPVQIFGDNHKQFMTSSGVTFYGDFIFTYAWQGHPEYCRNFNLSIPVSVSPGLQVMNFDILSCFPTSHAISDLTSNEDPFTTRQLARAISLTSDLIQKPSASSLSTSLSSTNSSINNIYVRNDECMIVFDVSNVSTSSYSLFCHVFDFDPSENSRETFFTQISSEPNSIKKICIPMKRFTLRQDEIPPLREPKGQYIKPTKHQQLLPEEEKELRILYWYKHEIQKRVRIVWRCPLYNSEGYLRYFGSSSKLLLTSAMVHKVKADIASFRFILSGNSSANPSSSVELNNPKIYYPIRQFRTIGVEIINTCKETMESAHIRIQPFQDLENGIRNTNLGGKLAWVGSLDFKLDDFKPQQKHSVHLNVCFLAFGTYQFVVSCENARGQSSSSHALQIKVVE